MTGESESFVCCGDWQLVREIGRGAYGVVYLAEGADGAWAAVKVCRRDDVGVERYERELRGAKLYRAIPPQEGLARMLDLAEEPWGFYAVMELADDEFERESPEVDSYRPKTLACVIEGEKALPLSECVKLGILLAKGLVALQRHHLLHRDIKPGNVIYVEGSPALSDPGLVVDESEAVSLVGTPGYVPPENFSAASGDVYGLGLTLKAASFGRCVEDLGKGPAPEADTGAKFFMAWWRILNKATDEDPHRRYQSAKALLKDLRKLRVKIATAAMFGSRLGKIAIVLGILSIVSAVIVNWTRQKRINEEVSRQEEQIAPLTKFKTDTENALERAKRETLWGIFCIRHDYLLNSDFIKDDIAKIAAIDKGKAVELQSRFDMLVALDAKDASLHEEIVALRDKAEEKVKKGLDDTAEFTHAQKISDARREIYKNEIKPLVEELYTAKKNVLEKVSRFNDWGNSSWSNERHKFNDSIDRTKRTIAKIEAVDRAKGAKLQSKLNLLIEQVAKEESLRQKCGAMYDEARKSKKGLDFEERLREIATEMDDLYENKMKSAANELDVAVKNTLERINRDWFWSLHDIRTCCLNSEPIKDCIKRTIAANEASEGKESKWYRDKFKDFINCEVEKALHKHEIDVLKKGSDEKVRKGLDDSAEFLYMRYLVFCRSYYQSTMNNTVSLSWLFHPHPTELAVECGYEFYDTRQYSLEFEFYLDVFKREVTLIETEDKVKGAELQACLGKTCELLARESAYQQAIDKLRQKASEKVQNGFDDEEEYATAQRIDEDARNLHRKELQPLVEKLCRLLHKNLIESRWDKFYTFRRYSFDSELELIRRGIAEVSAFDEKTAGKLQSQFDILVEGNERAAPLQRDIDLLRKTAKEKLRQGIDDEGEYRQAEKIYDKESSLYIHKIGNRVNYDALRWLLLDVRRGNVCPVRWANRGI